MKFFVAILVSMILTGCVVSNPVNTNTTQVAVGQTVLSLSTSSPSGQHTPAVNQTVAVIQMESQATLPDDSLKIKVAGSFATTGGKVTNLKVMSGDHLVAGPIGNTESEITIPLKGLAFTVGQTLQLKVVVDSNEIRAGASTQPVSLNVQARLEKQKASLVQSYTLTY